MVRVVLLVSSRIMAFGVFLTEKLVSVLVPNTVSFKKVKRL